MLQFKRAFCHRKKSLLHPKENQKNKEGAKGFSKSARQRNRIIGYQINDTEKSSFSFYNELIFNKNDKFLQAITEMQLRMKIWVKFLLLQDDTAKKIYKQFF